MPTHIEQELGIAPTTNRIRRWFGRFMPGADRSLDPLTVNYEVWRAISKNVRKWPTYQEAPNYVEVMVSPEDWSDYWGIDTTRKEAGVSTYVKARIAEKGLWVAGEPQVLVFEDEAIEMGELDIVCQFAEPMTQDELNALRSSIDHRPSYEQPQQTFLTDGDAGAQEQSQPYGTPAGANPYVQTTLEYEPMRADDGVGADGYAGDVAHASYVEEEALTDAPAIDVVDAKVERVEDEEPQYEDSQYEDEEPQYEAPQDVEFQERSSLQVPEFLAAEAQALEDSVVEMPVIEVPVVEVPQTLDDEELEAEPVVEVTGEPIADEEESAEEPIEGPVDEADESNVQELEEEPVAPVEEPNFEEPKEESVDVAEPDVAEDDVPSDSEVESAEQGLSETPNQNVDHAPDLPTMPESQMPEPDIALPADVDDALDGVDVEMSSLSAREKPDTSARKHVSKSIPVPVSIPEPAPEPVPAPKPEQAPKHASVPRPTSTVRFVDDSNPGNLYLVGDGLFRLEVHSGDCIGAVRVGESVPAQVNLRLDADAFPYAETMQCSIMARGGRWCVVNHAVHGTRLTKADGTRYLLGHPNPCMLDQGDLLWLGHERPLRVEY